MEKHTGLQKPKKEMASTGKGNTNNITQQRSTERKAFLQTVGYFVQKRGLLLVKKVHAKASMDSKKEKGPAPGKRFRKNTRETP